MKKKSEVLVGELFFYGVQDMLLQTMTLWHIGYFKLKEFEKMAEIGRSLIPLPASPLKQDIRPSCKR